MSVNAQKMRKIQFAELIEFVAVAEYRSFTQAAAQLGVSTATLRQAIRAVEDRLGLRLLNRTTRHVAPTPAAERLLVRLRPVMEELQSELEELSEYRHGCRARQRRDPSRRWDADRPPPDEPSGCS